MTKFLQIAFLWNDCKCEYLLKIKALFFKTENTMCVICPSVPHSLVESPPTPLDGEKACCMLRQVLVCLKELHSHKIVFGAVHPSTVLIEEKKILLDFCFNPDLDDSILKGINFHPPEQENSEKPADMYGFGCLVLWLLFPNLSFTSNDDGVPNIAAYRSIIEDALTTKDYALLCNLVNSKPKSRPSASHLLSKGFLSSYESYCHFRNKAVTGHS
nr:serine/threonine-protein kinase 31-like isoform X2 [Parasteatoda tepidariorum]